MQNPVGWFEIYVADMARAKAFYEYVLAQPLTEMPSSAPGMQMVAFPMSQGTPGAGGALVAHPMRQPHGQGTLVYFSCADCAVESGRVEAAGGTLAQPRTSIGPFGFVARATDTEGNAIGFHSFQ